ncbi:MAG: hypothetical protein JWM68_4061 [Verrucomicrobiales bacterium]|nr:hypothetical protein [Verrucomicrobiales bacterium]
MNKLPKEKQLQLLVVIVVTIAALGAIWFFIIGTEEKRLEAATRTGLEFKEKTDRAVQMLKQKEFIEIQKKRNVEELAAIEDAMAPGDKYAWFVPLLNKFSEPYKNISLVKVGKERQKTVELLPNFPYHAANFPVVLTGFYVDLGRFLADFENTHPYFQVQGIEMLPTASPTEDKEKLDIKFEIVTLIKPTTTE